MSLKSGWAGRWPGWEHPESSVQMYPQTGTGKLFPKIRPENFPVGIIITRKFEARFGVCVKMAHLTTLDFVICLKYKGR